jgi:tetratricopeptide (TPR) repeat protein
MNDPSLPLAGKHVAFTGRLASLTRSEAAALVKKHGGVFVPRVTRQTTLLVVGQEGWPLQKDGSLSRKLVLAHRMQAAGLGIAILPEADLLRLLGLEGIRDGVHGRFTLAELGRLLKVPRDRLRAWMRAGLVAPVDTVHGVAYFDFQQVTGVRSLWDMARAGVTLERLRRSLDKLQRWLPGFLGEQPLHLLERNGRLLVRLQQGQLVEPSGQLQLDFDAGNDAEAAALAAAPPPCADEWFERGCALEQAGELAEAVHAYREGLYLGGPDPIICFNLGNVLYQSGQLGQAAERFRQAIELDHAFTEAWNNLGNALLDLDSTDEAIAAFQRAVELSPDYGDAHYNLADALQQVERFSEARIHWKAFLRVNPAGAWADYARRCLEVRQRV